jgi:hypothetical protein
MTDVMEPVATTARSTSGTGRRAVGATVAGLLAMGAGLGIGAALWTGDDRGSTVPAASALLVIDGTSGYTEPLAGGRVRLHLAYPSVLFFEDRPRRGSGRVAPAGLVANWSKAFAGSPPFGALVVAAGPDASTPAAFKVTSPSIAKDGSLSFDLTPDTGVTAAEITRIKDLRSATSTERGRMALFLDNASWQPLLREAEEQYVRDSDPDPDRWVDDENDSTFP